MCVLLPIPILWAAHSVLIALFFLPLFPSGSHGGFAGAEDTVLCDAGDAKRSAPRREVSPSSLPPQQVADEPVAVTVASVRDPATGTKLLRPPYQLPDSPYRLWWKFFLFLRSWTLIFNISTRASAMLYRIIVLMLPQMKLERQISNFIIDKTLGIDAEKDDFVGYVCCPKCSRCVLFEEAFDKVQVSLRPLRFEWRIKNCTGRLLRNHSREAMRLCGHPLLQSIGAVNNPHLYIVPFLTFAYRPIKTRLCELLNRPGLEAMCERWRGRDVPKSHLGDVYDGSMWRDFQTVEGKPFLSEKNGYALSIFCDWFQPWRKVQYSVGVLFAVILNLPREERHKKENLFLVGIFPGGSEGKLNLQELLKPFVACLQELHPVTGGVRMATHLQRAGCKVTACVVQAVCDLPAGKKLSGFVGHSGDLGCSRCDKKWEKTTLSKAAEEKAAEAKAALVRRDGEGSTDSSGEEDSSDDEKEGKEEKKDEEPSVGHYVADAWSDLADDDVVIEGEEEKEEKKKPLRSSSSVPLLRRLPSKRDLAAEKKSAKVKERRADGLDAKARAAAKRRGRGKAAPGAVKPKRGRNWVRVYAKPGVMGTPQNLEQHRRSAKLWRDAPTKKAQEQQQKMTGVKDSEMLNISYWDPITMTVIDSMHAFWLGVCRHLMKMWRDSKWSSGTYLDTMQKRLNAMRVPPDVCRLLNKWAANMSNLTAHQIKAFVGCFSLVVYCDFLEEEEEALWGYLVVASRLLSLYAITLEQVDLVLLALCCSVCCNLLCSPFSFNPSHRMCFFFCWFRSCIRHSCDM